MRGSGARVGARRCTRRGAWLVAALAAAVVAASSADAGLLDGLLDPCAQPTARPFVPWLDSASYALAPNGGFEQGSAGWTLAAGARVVSGNEPFHVRGAADAWSLALPDGASATSAPVCAGTLSPTLRLFARNTGAASSMLRVEVLYTDALGLRWSVPIGTLRATSDWQPTAPLLLLANVTSLPLLTGGTAQVQLRFTPQGPGGAWQLDDGYVDPYKGT